METKIKIKLVTLPIDEQGNIYQHGFTSMEDFEVVKLSSSLMNKLVKVTNKKMGKINKDCVDSLKVYFEESDN